MTRVDLNNRHAFPLLVLLLAWLYYAGPLLLPSSNLYLTDTYCQDVPLRVYAAKMIRSGEFPYWTTKLQCGFHFFADGQTGILYPFFALYLLSPTPEMHDVFMALHFLLAALLTYLFLAGRGILPWGAAIGGVTFMAGSYLQSNHIVPGVLATACWLPLALFLIDRFVAGQRRALWWCAAVNATMLLAGHVQASLICYTLEAAWLVYGLRPKTIGSATSAFAVCFVLPLTFAAMQMWPTYIFLSMSNRASGGLESSLDWQSFSDFGIGWEHLPLFVMPDYLGNPHTVELSHPQWVHTPWEEGWVVFHGFAAVVFVPLAIGLGWRRRDMWFWMGVALLGLLLSGPTPVRVALYYVPIYNLFRWPARYMLWFSFAVSVLTACGASALFGKLSADDPRKGRRWVPWLVGLVVVASMLGVVYRNMSPFLTQADFYQIGAPEVVRASRAGDHFRLLPAVRALYRYWNADEQQLRKNAAVLPASYNLMFNVPVATLFDQGNAVSLRTMGDLIDRRHPNFLKLAAVTHISSPEPIDQLDRDETTYIQPVALPPADDIELIDSQPVYVYRYLPARPRAWMVYRAAVIEDYDARLDYLCDDEFDPAVEVVLEHGIDEMGAPSKPARVEVRQPSETELIVDVETSAAGVLVVADAHSSQFMTSIDGRPVELLRANHAFRGVFVPAGSHRVVMKFEPIRFDLGIFLSSLGLIVWVIGIVRSGSADRAEQADDTVKG